VRARAEQACAELGFDAAAWSTPVGELPLGIKRIVEVARAMAADARVVCLDEPAAGLGGDDLELIGDTLRRLAARGCAVLLIEHNLAFVQRYCDSIVLLESGEVTVRSMTGAIEEDGAADGRMAAFFGSVYVAGQRSMAES
jgi:ABC-type branched-subunit amino acid transport system ATPase component